MNVPISRRARIAGWLLLVLFVLTLWGLWTASNWLTFDCWESCPEVR